MNRADYQTCSRCPAPVLPDDPNTFVRVEGWQRRSASPSRRGASDIVLREQVKPAKFLCGACAHALKAGVAPLQESLLGAAA
jgi:hypothetical protein